MELIEGGNERKESFDADMVCDALLSIPPKNEFDAKRQEREMDKFHKFMDKVNNTVWVD